MKMTRFLRVEVVNAIYERGLVPSFTLEGVESPVRIAKACGDGGARVVLCRVQHADDVPQFEALADTLAAQDPAIMLGAGSVDDSKIITALLQAGAAFIVGAGVDAEVARQCHCHKVNYIPTCRSLSDIENAEELGVETVMVDSFEPELTPASMENFLQKRPWSRIMKSGEVQLSEKQLTAWIQAGTACIGIDIQSIIDSASPDAISSRIAELSWFVRKARGENLFCGIEHLGIYPEAGQDASELTGWYSEMFEFGIDEGESWYFVHSSGSGRIEILKSHEPTKAHVAIKVRHFETAMKILAGKGIEFESIKDFGRVKAVFLKQRDPAGHKVHLLYQALI
jgi:2-dehydro-3-deoxyphosphogluconate aldolase/(4S)-4-hydroxy-2-oxoglutarate aldolase